MALNEKFTTATLPSIMPQTIKITLVDNEQGIMQPLYKSLTELDFAPQIFPQAEDVVSELSKIDILILDIGIAQQPKSSKLIKVSTILVLSENELASLPPWLQSRHIFLLPYPQDLPEFANTLADFLPSRTADFALEPYDAEHLALLFGITQFLSGHLDIDDLFERILDLAPYLDAEFSSLLILEGKEIIYYRSTQPGREELIGNTGRRFAQRLLDDGLEGWMLQHQQPVLLDNTLSDPRWLRASYLPDEAHAVAAVPFYLDRVEARGVYLIGHRQPDQFTPQKIPLLKAAMTQISMAVENAMLFKNQSQRSVQLSLINEVSQAATSILNLDVMLRTVVQAIRRSFAFYSVAVYLYRHSLNVIELQARATSDRYSSTWPEKANEPQHFRLNEGLVGWAAATNKTVLVNDVTQDSRYSIENNPREIRAELCVPIVMGAKNIGVLDLQSTQLEAFDNYHVSALETLADQLAIAIENARLYDEINHHVIELQSLNQISQAVTSTLDLSKTLTLVTDSTIRLMEVAAASLVLRDNKQGDVWFAAASGAGSESVIGTRMALGQGIAGWVADQGKALMVPNVYQDERFFAELDKRSGFVTEAILCVPLQTKGHTIGAIEVMNKQEGPFDQDDQELLQKLANSAATAIENAQLYEETTQTLQRLAETQSQLIQSAKLAAVGELAAGIAHEINNPLTTIIGLTSLARDSVTSQETYEDLDMVYDEACRARDIVRNLLNFARADTPQRQPTDFNQLIEEAIFLVYTKSVSQKVTLEKSLSPLPNMYLDINQMKQVIVNLLNNAIYAMLDNAKRPAKLTITTHLQPGQQDGQDGQNKSLVICKISDTGQGIAAEHLPKIFDPFFTTKEVGQGTGLGLSISYGIIEKHGGTITVNSTPHQGTTFTITLAAQQSDEAITALLHIPNKEPKT